MVTTEGLIYQQCCDYPPNPRCGISMKSEILSDHTPPCARAAPQPAHSPYVYHAPLTPTGRVRPCPTLAPGESDPY